MIQQIQSNVIGLFSSSLELLVRHPKGKLFAIILIDLSEDLSFLLISAAAISPVLYLYNQNP